jgi:FeS assembly protein IscX
VGLTWDAPVEIAYALVDAHPEVDPLDLNFVELHRWIVDLPDFDDDPEAASEAKLEAIVLAWHAEL